VRRRIGRQRGGDRSGAIALGVALAALLIVAPKARAIQLEAPSGNVVSPALIDRLASPRLFSGDFDWPYEDRGEGLAFTLRGSPLSWLAGSSADSAARWEPRPVCSRLGASFTLGGPTQTDDRIVESRHHRVSDHVTGELKLPFFGPIPDDSGDRPDTGAPVVLGGSLAADIYSTGFGRDLYMATLLAEGARGLPWNANLGFRAEEKVHHERNDELKVGLGSEAGWHHPMGIVEAIEGSVSGAVLLRNRGREDVWLANTRVDVPMRGHVKAVGAVTWSNSPERIRVPVVRGRLALAYQFMGRR
jgi:hypothetical protein